MATATAVQPVPVLTEHPHIARYAGVQGGTPVIAGTRLDVATLAAYHTRHGYPVEQLLEAYPNITPAQMHDAISYYYDHKDEIEVLILEREEAYQRHCREMDRELAPASAR